MFLAMMALLGTGYVRKYILLSGSQSKMIYGHKVQMLLAGIDRKGWATIHLYLGYFILALLVIHIILHWKQVKIIYKRLIPNQTLRNIVTVLFVVLSLFLAVFPFVIEPQVFSPAGIDNNMGSRGVNEPASIQSPADLSEININDFAYPSTYPKFEIKYANQTLSWLKGDSSFTGEPGGIIGNTMFGMNEEHTDFLEANIVKPGSELVFAAGEVPGLNPPAFKLHALGDNHSLSTYPLNRNIIQVPQKDGGYIFMLNVDWGNGDNEISYWFKVRVNS